MKKVKVLSVGEVLWDLFPDGERFGGAPANFACHAALQGADVTMLSAVGDDKRGHDALHILRDIGIDVGLVQIVPNAPTGTVGIELDDDAKPTYQIHEGSAWDQLEWRDEIGSHVKEVDAICFGTLGQRSEVSRQTIRKAAESAMDAGVTRVVDINLRAPFFDATTIRDSVQFASILKLSDEELSQVCSACGVAQQQNDVAMLCGLREFGALDVVVMTQGAHGAVLITENSLIDQEGIPATVIDTVGAGDSFTAAFLIGELKGDARHESLRKACEVAAEVCSHSGAVPD